MGVFIGVVVLLVCIGFVVLMMVTEWSSAPTAQPLAENPAPAPASANRRSAKPRAAAKKGSAKKPARPVAKAKKKKK